MHDHYFNGPLDDIMFIPLKHTCILKVKKDHNTLTCYDCFLPSQKKCEVYWPENADAPFVPCPGSPINVEFKSALPFAEFVVRKMVVTHVCF